MSLKIPKQNPKNEIPLAQPGQPPRKTSENDKNPLETLKTP